MSASLTCPARCARRLLAVLGDVARIDYPARWPALLSAGLLSAASSQAHAMGGAVAADADAGADAAVAAAGERLCRVLLALHSVLKGTAASKTPRCVQAHRQAVAETLPVVTALWQEHAAALSGRLASIVDAVRSSAAGAAAGPAGDQLSRAGAVVAPVPAVSAAAALAPLAPAMRRFRLCCKCLRRCILAGEASALVPGPSGGHVWPACAAAMRAALSAHRALWSFEASTSGSGRPLSDVGAGSSWELLDNLCAQLPRLPWRSRKSREVANRADHRESPCSIALRCFCGAQAGDGFFGSSRVRQVEAPVTKRSHAARKALPLRGSQPAAKGDGGTRPKEAGAAPGWAACPASASRTKRPQPRCRARAGCAHLVALHDGALVRGKRAWVLGEAALDSLPKALHSRRGGLRLRTWKRGRN